MLQVLEALALDLVQITEVMNACFLAPIFALGENLSFFLAMDDFEPTAGGVYNICDNFFDGGGVVANFAYGIDNVGEMFDR